MSRIKAKIFGAALAFFIGSACSSLKADDAIEKSGQAIGVSAGNLIVIPVKAASMSLGVFFGALSYVLTGGNADLTKQIWQDTSQGPYLVTPELAKKSVGQRPELMRQSQPSEPPALPERQ
jgi:hypothetical protein